MKDLISKLAIVLVFACGNAFAAIDTSPPATTGAESTQQGQLYAGEGHGDYEGCNKNKWEDT